MVCLELATPVAKTCDAGGGALRPECREWPVFFGPRLAPIAQAIVGVTDSAGSL
jgi:hypothetical protein